MITRNRALALALGFVCSSAAAAAKTPMIVEFDAPNAFLQPGYGTSVTRIDDKGDVIGTYFDPSRTEHGFMRRADGSFLFYGTSAQPVVSMPGINSHQQTAGTIDIGGILNGFTADAFGNITAFSVSGSTGTQASGIDDSGDIVGAWSDANSVSHAFLRNKRGKIKSFDAPGAGSSVGQGTFASGISADGVICGFYVSSDSIRHGFVRDPDGTITTVDGPGATRTSLTKVNATDTATGYDRDANGVNHGLVHAPDGTLTVIDVPGAGTAETQGTLIGGLNKKGVMAGEVIDGATVDHSYVRTAKGKATTFDPPDASLTAGSGSFAVDINTKGSIAGSYIDANGILHGYLRTP